MRTRSIRTLTGVLGAVCIATLVAGCSASPTPPSIPTALRLAQANPVPTLDPANWYDNVSQGYMHAIYDTLVQYGPNDATIEPDLATGWKISNGGKTYVFTLRKGVKFSNGDAFNAKAVQYNVQRMTSKAAAAPYAFAYSAIQGFSAWNAGTAQSLSGVTVLGPRTVEFDLTEPDGTFLNALAMMSAAIGDPKVEAKYGLQGFSDNAVGTGPYALSKWVHGHQLVLTRNPRYWGKEPSIKTISTTIGLSAAQQLREFQKGQLDMIGTWGGALDAASYQRVEKSRKLRGRLRHAPADAVTFLGFNVATPPFGSLAVRQAVNDILQRDAVNAALTGGRAPLDNAGLLSPGMPGYRATDAYPYAVDLTTAAQLLKSAGITPAHPASFELAFEAGAPNVLSAMQVVQQELAPLGLKATLKPVPWNTFFTSAANASETTYGMYLLTWSADYPDPQDLFDNLFAANGPANFSGFRNAQIDDLVAKADALPTATAEESQRIADYRQANQILLQQAPAVFLNYGYQDALVQTWVHYGSLGALGLGPVYTAEFSQLSLGAHK